MYPAKKSLQQSNYAAIPTDEHEGYCTIEVYALKHLVQTAMQKPCYQEASWVNNEHVRRDFESICKKRAETFGDKGIQKNLIKRFYNGSKQSCSRLEITVTTHKPAGQVCLRIIHSCTNHIFADISTLYSYTIREHIRVNYPWVYDNTDDILQALRDVHTNGSAILPKCDLNDFDLNGDHDTMCTRVSQPVWGAGSGGHHDVLYGMLTNQFVSTPVIEDGLWQVTSGAGMGFPCAGDVSDVNYAELVEKDLMRNVRNLGLLFYGRFRDGILCLVQTIYD